MDRKIHEIIASICERKPDSRFQFDSRYLRETPWITLNLQYLNTVEATLFSRACSGEVLSASELKSLNEAVFQYLAFDLVEYPDKRIILTVEEEEVLFSE